jgi:hypothetical protein
MKSIVKKKPRHEVISIRLNEDRLKLLERYQKVLSEQRGREVSLGEAAFLVIEERVESMDRETARHEMLNAPTASLFHIRKKWDSERTLSAAEWDVLANYVQIGAEEETQEPPLISPAIPSRGTYIDMLNAFEAVYFKRQNRASRHVWSYLRNLGGDSVSAPISEENGQAGVRALRDQIVSLQEQLRTDRWQRPGSVGRCLLMAIRDEGLDSAQLDQALAPFWATLWGLAARGHWLRHDRQPVRATVPNEEDFRQRITLPDALRSNVITVSFTGVARPELAMTVDLGPARRVSFAITRYPELAEFQTMLVEWRMERSWNGRHFVATSRKEKSTKVIMLSLRRSEVSIEFAEQEWTALRELSATAAALPEIERWLAELRLEYGEHG